MSLVQNSHFFINPYDRPIQNNQKVIRLLLVGDRLGETTIAKINEEIPTEISIAIHQQEIQEIVEYGHKFHPDVVIIDLPEENKIAFDWLLASEFNVIAIGDFKSSRVLSQAIAAGVKGYLWANPSIEDLVAAIQAAMRGSCYFAPGILEQHSSLFSSLFPTQAKLEKLTCYLAVEVIEQWRLQVLKKLPPVSEALKDWGLGSWDKNEILTSLEKIDSNRSLFDELNFRLERERSLSRLPQRQRVIFAAASLQQAVTGLETWLIADVADRSNCGCRARLQLNAQNLRIETSNRLKHYISEFWSVTGPESLLAWLKDIESKLVAANSAYEEQQQEYRHKSEQAWNSYQNLLEKLQQSSVPEKAQEILTYAWTALACVYQFKIHAEINGLASQLVVGLIQQIQSYSEILLQANDFLLDLQQQIAQKASLREVSGSHLAIALAEKTLPSQLREELSLAMGNSLNQWGNSISITSDRLKKYLLERLRPIALDIYRESCREICQISADEPTKEF